VAALPDEEVGGVPVGGVDRKVTPVQRRALPSRDEHLEVIIRRECRAERLLPVVDESFPDVKRLM
jgi:hypothetical protein